MKKLSLLFLITLCCLQAQIPVYYQNIDFTQSPENVQAQLEQLVRNTHLFQLSYTPQTWEALRDIDADPDNREDVLLIYGYDDNDEAFINDRSRNKNLSCHTSYCEGKWNREHVYPKSVGDYDTDTFPGSDVHALRACDSQMNSYRSNYPYIDGEGNSGVVVSSRFYPGDEWKGDVARMIMYMYLRYPDKCLPNYVGVGPNTYNPNVPDIFLEWNAEDPVSEYEIYRNNVAESTYQGNRNPFIDNPYLATMLWGGPTAQNNWEELSIQEVEEVEFTLSPNPTRDYVIHKDRFDNVSIYDLNGRLVGSDKNLTDDKIYLPAKTGLYFIKLCKKGNCQTVKVLKN